MVMLAAGICQAGAYHGADHGRGIAYVLLPTVSQATALRRDDPTRRASVFAQLLQLPYPPDHHAAFAAYVQQKSYTAETNGPRSRGTRGAHQLTATFNGAGHLTQLPVNQMS